MNRLKINFFVILFSLILAYPSTVVAEKKNSITQKEYEKLRTETLPTKRPPKHYYQYKSRHHSTAETWENLGIVYGVSWVVYPLSQWSTFKDEGSFKNYKKNFGKVVFDQDEPFWNWFIHPLSGSQIFLFYRAKGYTRIDSLALSFISSALFEFTIETYTEPASAQDLYQTPVLGSMVGVGIESLSLYLLHSGNAFGEFFGHLINPMTMFDLFEHKVRIIPTTNLKNQHGLWLAAEF
jgi:hypothetical protein